MLGEESGVRGGEQRRGRLVKETKLRVEYTLQLPDVEAVLSFRRQINCILEQIKKLREGE